MDTVTAAPSATAAPRLGTLQFAGYAAGDAANNLAFSMTSFFLLIYYTDVVGISAAAAGTLFLLIRIWDAFADIFAGRVVDRTMTRWGKFRPFFVFAGPPVLLLSVVTFTVPRQFDGGGAQLAAAYVTYGLLGLAYSLVNIPYGSLAAAMTQRPGERAKLASFRMIGTAVTTIMLAFVVSPQIQQYRGDPDGFQRSLLITTLIFAVVGVALYLFLFLTARESVQRDVAHVSAGQSFTTLRRNKPLIMLCLSSLAFLTALFSLQTVQVYYARDVLGNAELLTALTVLSVGAIFLVAPLMPRLVRAVGKKRAFLSFGAVGLLAGIGISVSPPSTPWVSMTFFGIMGVSTAGINTLMWALEADTVEYGEWQTGVRTEGITYALFSFTRKLGQAVGGAVAAYAIALGGYVGGAAVQDQQALDAIRYASGFIPVAFILIGMLIFFRYPLTEQTFATMVAETQARRAAR
ncbi:glucuronide transporter [Actinoplanes sp. NBRC 14428]|uniref:Glucuronide carrier protein n=1 Tax=Pseudosporangium ferrugineum TaxID=439699 RepID=A0A2T0RHD0_9ACTN|nr:glycoside-pentoside-hexuronide (GPH):cation symporter [Pseudosporangium ferrugineum]PRY20549.1 glucuronide carrier protein [Pseudosporangium ferrugineum]BCJ51361.1 glucuronide transporter [Actinoplanes sp. NBRC 14428]